MPTTTSSKTMDNLKTAFAGESQANRKYLAFAQKADKDGFPNVARLFRAAAEAETVHALGHLNAMGIAGSTADNLKAAFSGETYEYKEMYPPMLETATQEGHRAKVMFNFAIKAEEVHAKLYAKALEAIESGKDFEAPEIYLCPFCGHLEIGKPSAKCPICSAAPEKYKRIS